jgi:acetyl-CoA carboxylase carboxyltransferase component
VETEESLDLEFIRADLDEVVGRRERTLDAARPNAVATRRERGQRTARENLADLCDPGSFREYGGLTVAAQRARRSLEELIDRTPADGLVAGTARVNGSLFDGDAASCVVLAYDYTVLAGTQGKQSHRKTDRMLAIGRRLRLPVIVFAEGGGGRPGDTDTTVPYGLENMTFVGFARLSGLVPRIGISSGRCFAGNAAILGCCDIIIATENSNIGMAGPAAIEGGALGMFRAEDIGPLAVQVPNGVVDVAVKDEAEAVREAKRSLAFFQGAVAEWDCHDQRPLRFAVPSNRKRSYDVRPVISTIADAGSVLELRKGFGPGMITALIRIEGRPLGVLANNPLHLGGAIDADGADKAARFLQLCEAHAIPVLFLCDTPGIMVGPEAEKTALVRHASRMFIAGSNLTVPVFAIVLRKAYGLGANAMTAGSLHAPVLTVAWPTGEFGGMNLEGAVKLSHRRELEAIGDPDERRAAFERMVAEHYEVGRAISAASYFEIDDVIDPAESRGILANALRSAPVRRVDEGERQRLVDTW